MAKNVRLIPQHRKRLQPSETNGTEANGAARAVVVDEQTYWTGRDYAFTVVNDSIYPRWYRIVVTNLKYRTEYLVFTPDGPLPEESMLALEGGDQARITIILGGEVQGDPKTPRQFEIYVQQYVTPDARGEYELLLNDKLQWIPRPDNDSIAVTVTPDTIRVRPWQRRAQFAVALANRSYLPVQARIRAVPAEENKAAGLEETVETLRDPIAAQEEQPVLCDVTIAPNLKDVVSLNVGADVDIPALDITRTTPTQRVEIVPVPLLKAWQDWVVVGVGVFLLVWLLVGIPPFVHPYTQVVIHFVGTPPVGAKPTDIDITLTPIDSENRSANLPQLHGTPAPTLHNDTFIYNFDWGWMFRGFRWTWNDYKLKLSIPSNPKYLAFDNMEDHPLDGEISRRFGVDHSRFIVDWNKAKAILLTVNFVGDNKPKPTDDVSLQVLLDGTPVLTDKYFPGKQFQLPDDKVAKSTAYQVRVIASNVTTGADADSGVIPLKPDIQPHDIPLRIGVKTATITIPSGDPVVAFQWEVRTDSGETKRGSSSGGSVLVPVAMHSAKEKATVIVNTSGMPAYQKPLPLNPDVPADFGPWKGKQSTGNPEGTGSSGGKKDDDGKGDKKSGGGAGGTPGGSGGKQSTGQSGSGGKNGGGNGGKNGGGTHSQILVDVRVPAWCAALGKPELAKDLVMMMSAPNALEITRLFVSAPDAEKNYSVSFNVSDSCYVQIYETAGNGNIQPLLVGLDGNPSPVLAKAEELFKREFPMDKGYDQIIVLACKESPMPGTDLNALLEQRAASLVGWAIAGEKYPHR